MPGQLPRTAPASVQKPQAGRALSPPHIEQLRTSEAKFGAISMALPDPCGITRVADGRYIEVNPAFCAFLGMPREAVVGRTSVELGIWATPQDREALLAMLTTEGRADRLLLNARAQGRVVPGLMSARKVQIDGEDCMVFVFHDLTEERRLYADLLAAHGLLAQAGHMAKLGAWETDATGALAHWSDVCAEVHGFVAGTAPPSDYIGRCLAPQWSDAMRAAVRSCLRDGTSWTLDVEIVRADTGKLLWMRVHGEAVREGVRTVRMRGVMQDIDAAHHAEQALRDSQERFRLMFDMLPYPMGITHLDGRYIEVNPAWEAMTGYQRAEATGQTALDLGLYGLEDRQRTLAQASNGGDISVLECSLIARSGEVRTVQQATRQIQLLNTPCRLFALHDITDRKRAEEAVLEREALLSLTLEAASLGLWDCDLESGLVTGDARWHQMRGEDFPADLAMPWQQCASPADIVVGAAEMRRHMRHPETLFDIVTTVPGALAGTRWLRSLGKIVEWGPDKKARRMLGVSIDVTGQREQEVLLQRLAHYDALTDLPNRVLLAKRLAEAMAQARASGQLLGVAYLDLDGFKPVNDRFGHEGGDQLLRCTAARLTQSLRPQDCVARLGGDEFAILLPDLAATEDAQRALDRLMQSISAPYTLLGEPVSVTASIGYTLYPRDDSDADTLLRHADQAMYGAKQAGRNQFQEFDAIQERAARHTRAQVLQVRDALEAGQFELYLQPKVDMRLGKVIGAEALARWNHPERGLLSPAEFLPLIEGTELDTPFGAWVVQAGLALLKRLGAAGRPLPLSINISAPHLQQSGFSSWMAAQLATCPEVPAHLLDIEITETAALLQIDNVAQTLRELRALDMTISLDDFGTGYSSLTYLRRLPLNTLKIDQSFVRGMADEAGDLAIVQGVIGLARSFGYSVIAEGVETEEQGRMLLQMGCKQAQGYFIARPMPVGQLLAWACDWQAPDSWRA